MEFETMRKFDKEIEKNIEKAMSVSLDESIPEESRRVALAMFEGYYERYHEEIDRRNFWGLEKMKFELEKHKVDEELKIERKRREDDRFKMERELAIMEQKRIDECTNARLGILGKLGESLIKAAGSFVSENYKVDRQEKSKDDRLKRILSYEENDVVSGIGKIVVNDSVK